ncbi:3-oxoadipate enol-lactonase [Polynucleobacter sp. MWH-Braz-FAM2G]|uniref:3-oxoadipate enol-lactonase n=1 Tax=Polynucleobacter sp. MWH-Braz-FAM2G TaxID=1855883 RepID=UPI001BFCDC93|nr:3-oxoadipate enol-lactonase [Polynucleobacter sp. MWH-Braz-FAM2G]QWD91124.1 3-oxoadipate enol-lactonase [Polynucleobacter sp. MWH-Braz-FAM2G]
MTQLHDVKKVKVDGTDVAYRFDGPEDGRVVLVANSLMANGSMWDGNVAALADRYRVLRYDKRGHGASGVSEGPYTIAQLADDAVGLLDALKIEKAHFMGLSIGGMIGQQLGARYPERILSLSLCNTASEMPPRSLWEERFEIARTQGIAGLVDGTIKRWFTAAFIERAPQEIEKVRQMILGTNLNGYIACGSAVRDMAQSTMLLKIKAPTLVLSGRDDPACTVDQGTVLHRLIDNSKMVIIEQAAHLSNIEQPEIFNRTVRQFIDSVDDAL